MNVPKNVLWFEALLYMSLTLDALSVAFQDRTPSAEMTEQMITVATVMAAFLILLLVFFVWLAAQRRKNWPRWAPQGCFRSYSWCRSSPTAACSSIAASRSFHAS